MNATTTSASQAVRADAAAGSSAWDRIARDYDRTNTPTQMWLGNEGLKRAGLRSRMRFLDVAAGSGALAIPAARLGAHVFAVDQSSTMLELLTARALRERLSIETRAMDGHALAFDDNSFDLAGSQFGVMLFPDMPRGIREMARVVAPGGKLLITAYADPHRIDFLTFFVRAVQSVRPDFSGPPSVPPPLPFQLQDPARLREELCKAGLHDVHVESITESTEFRSGAEFWDWVVSSNPIVTEILEELHLSDTERAAVIGAAAVLIRERSGDDGVAILTNPINIGIGTKP